MWFLIMTEIIFVSGILAGIAHSLHKMYGYSHVLFGEHAPFTWENGANIGIIPSFMLKAWVFSLAGAEKNWLTLTGKIPPSSLFLSLGIGILAAVVHSLIVSRILKMKKRIVGEITGGLILGGIGGGIMLSGLLFSDHSVEWWILVAGAGLGGVFGALIVLVSFLAYLFAILIFALVSSLLSVLKCVPGLCPHCFRHAGCDYAAYYQGRRYCAYCRQEIPSTRLPHKVVFTFGTVSLPADENVVVFSNPDVTHKKQPIDVSEMYIDLDTCDTIVLERCLTFLLNYPPLHGITQVKVFYTGVLKSLGNNLTNVLRNTFSIVEPSSKNLPASPADLLPVRGIRKMFVRKALLIAAIIGMTTGPSTGLAWFFFPTSRIQVAWESILDATSDNSDNAWTIQTLPGRGYLGTAGTKNEGVLLFRLDEQGQPVWQHDFNGHPRGVVHAIHPVMDGEGYWGQAVQLRQKNIPLKMPGSFSLMPGDNLCGKRPSVTGLMMKHTRSNRLRTEELLWEAIRGAPLVDREKPSGFSNLMRWGAKPGNALSTATTLILCMLFRRFRRTVTLQQG